MKITESQFTRMLNAYQYNVVAQVSPDAMRHALKTINVKVMPDSEMIEVNGITLPAPERTEPALGTSYYLAGTVIDPSLKLEWNDDDESDKDWLKRGLVYLKKKDAKAVVEAMMKPLTKYMEKNRENP